MTGTITRLARDWQLDVSVDSVTWLQLVGMNDFAETITPTMVDTTDYDQPGWDSSEPVTNAWKLVVKLNRKSNAGVSDASQEILRACRGKLGDAARAYVRWYKRADGTEAKQGRAIIEWNPSKTTVKDAAEIQVTATGDGILADIANVSVTPQVPTVTSVSPQSAATGAQVTIVGTGFLSTIATTGVKVGGVNAVPFTVVSDQVIVATVPAGTGSTPVVVTNTAGPSVTFTYTHG